MVRFSAPFLGKACSSLISPFCYSSRTSTAKRVGGVDQLAGPRSGDASKEAYFPVPTNPAHN